MADGTITALTGIAAGLLSSASFVPQLVKAWREGDCSAISTRMYLVTVTAFSLWIIYGWLISSLPVILFNAISLLLAGAILALKLRDGGRAGSAADAPTGPAVPVRPDS